MAQEALTNVVRHAGASTVLVRYCVEPAETSLTIEDDGVGFDAEAGSLRLGLRSLEERVQRIGGTLDIESGVGEGTSLSAVVGRSR